MAKRAEKRPPLNEVTPFADLREMVFASVERYADRDAFLIKENTGAVRAVSYAAFGRDLCALSTALLDEPSKRVALLGENDYAWLLSYFAVTTTNHTVVPLDKELTSAEIAALIDRTGAEVLIVSPLYREEALYAAGHARVRLKLIFWEPEEGYDDLPALLERGRALLQAGDQRYQSVKIDRDGVCSILFTSGTTGASKGVMLSHRNLCANIVAARQLVTFRPDDVLVSILPIHHAYEDIGGIFCPLQSGSTIAFCPGIKQVAECLQLYRPSMLCLVPLYLQTFDQKIWQTAAKTGQLKKLKRAVSLCNVLEKIGVHARHRLLKRARNALGGRLETIICGGAYLDPALARRFESLGIQVLQGYGITECSPLIAANRQQENRIGSVGYLAPCNQVRFDSTGQILVKGENVMLGYLDDPEGTESAFEGDWFCTGDLGYQDRDGFLYITGRSKDLIVLQNGKNVVPEEIETLLMRREGIAEAVVMPLREDGDATGIQALVYPDPALGLTGEALVRRIQDEVDAVNAQLAYYKRIYAFTLRDEPIPKTTTQKFQRFKLS